MWMWKFGNKTVDFASEDQESTSQRVRLGGLYVQSLRTKSGEVERTGDDSAFRTDTPIQHETAKGKEPLEYPGAASRPLSRVQFADQHHFENRLGAEPDSRGFFNYNNSSSLSDFDDWQGDFDQGTKPYTTLHKVQW
jgi:hypothetical protein